MSWLSSFIGDLTGRNATNAAVNAQNESTDRSIDLMERMYEDGVRRQQPWDDARMSFMGISPQPANAFSVSGRPGQPGEADYGGYVSNSPGLQNAFNALRPQDISSLTSGGYDVNGDGEISQNEYGKFHYSNFGQSEGRELPTFSAPTGDSQAISLGNGAYGSTTGTGITGAGGGGFDYTNNPLYTSMMNTTEADFQRITDAAGAGGNVLSGNYLTALNDQNQRNENAAVGQVWNALNGGFVGAQGQAQQGNAFAGQVANLETNRGANNASSYFNQGMMNQNLLARGIGAAAGAWF